MAAYKDLMEHRAALKDFEVSSTEDDTRNAKYAKASDAGDMANNSPLSAFNFAQVTGFLPSSRERPERGGDSCKSAYRKRHGRLGEALLATTTPGARRAP